MTIDISAIPNIQTDTLKELYKAMEKFEINTQLRACHFLSQVKHESGNFSRVIENLNYSAQGLRVTFPKYFPDIDTALHYERKPEMIANKVYANRIGNGDQASGEGFKFRGRGYIQLTGKSNYNAFGKSIGEDLINTPDLLTTPKYASLSAAWFFNKNGLNIIADKGSSDLIIQEITKKINGGLNGISKRIANFKSIFPFIKIV